jgi:hypothetical protein
MPHTEVEKMWKKVETGFVRKLIHASIANIYGSDRLGSLHAIVQSKSIYQKSP